MHYMHQRLSLPFLSSKNYFIIIKYYCRYTVNNTSPFTMKQIMTLRKKKLENRNRNNVSHYFYLNNFYFYFPRWLSTSLCNLQMSGWMIILENYNFFTYSSRVEPQNRGIKDIITVEVLEQIEMLTQSKTYYQPWGKTHASQWRIKEFAIECKHITRYIIICLRTKIINN